MDSDKEFLTNRRDFQQESARHVKVDIATSFILAATGISFVGAGITAVFNGDIIPGSIITLVGAGLALTLSKVAMDEVQDHADMTAEAAVFQAKIDALTEQHP